MRIEKLIFCQPIIIRSIWFLINNCIFVFLKAFKFSPIVQQSLSLFFVSMAPFFRFLFNSNVWHFMFLKFFMFLIHIEYQSICFEQLRYRVYVCVIWQVKFWLCLFARFLRHVWHQKHENCVLFLLVSWQYLVSQSIVILLLAIL